MDEFLLLKLLSSALLPPASMVVGLLAGAAFFAFGARRAALLVSGLAVLETAALSVPPVADALIEPLERQARAAAQLAPSCCFTAIVVLGGAVLPATPPFTMSFELNDAADRIWYAAELFRRGVAPEIIASGGDARTNRPPGGNTEADAMRQVLLTLGVPDEAIVREGRSRNTRENFAYIRPLVRDQIALVTSAYHMPRALKLAHQMHIDAAAFPTDFRIPAGARPPWRNWLPNVEALTTSNYALWEYIALAFDYRH